jgi:hypothetical protein
MNADTAPCCKQCGTPLRETHSPISSAKYLLCPKCFAVYKASEMLRTAVRTPEPVRKPTLDDRNYAVRCPICGATLCEQELPGGRYHMGCPKCRQWSDRTQQLLNDARKRRSFDYLRLIGKDPNKLITLKVKFCRKGKVSNGSIVLRGIDSYSEAYSAIEKSPLFFMRDDDYLTLRNWGSVGDAWGAGRKPSAFAVEMEGQTLHVIYESYIDHPPLCLYGCPNARRTDDLPRRRQVEVIRYE